MVKDTVEFETVVGRHSAKRDNRSADDEQFRLALEKEELRKLIFENPPQAPSKARGESAVRTEPEIRRLDERRSGDSIATDGARFRSPRARDVAAAHSKAKRNARSDANNSEPTDRRRARSAPSRNLAGAAERPETLPAVSYIAAAVLLVASGLGARLVWPGGAVDPLPRPNRIENVRMTKVAPKATRPTTRDDAIADPPKLKRSLEMLEEASLNAATEQARPQSSEIAVETPSLGVQVAPAQTTAADEAAAPPPNARIWPGRFSFSDNVGAHSAMGLIRFSASPRVESPAASDDAKPASESNQIRNDEGPNAVLSHIKKRMPPRPRSVAPAATAFSTKTRAAEQSDIVGQDRVHERRDDDRAEQLKPASYPTSNEFERPSWQGALESLAGMLRDRGQPHDGAR